MTPLGPPLPWAEDPIPVFPRCWAVTGTPHVDGWHLRFCEERSLSLVPHLLSTLQSTTHQFLGLQESSFHTTIQGSAQCNGHFQTFPLAVPLFLPTQLFVFLGADGTDGFPRYLDRNLGPISAPPSSASHRPSLFIHAFRCPWCFCPWPRPLTRLPCSPA